MIPIRIERPWDHLEVRATRNKIPVLIVYVFYLDCLIEINWIHLCSTAFCKEVVHFTNVSNIYHFSEDPQSGLSQQWLIFYDRMKRKNAINIVTRDAVNIVLSYRSMKNSLSLTDHSQKYNKNRSSHSGGVLLQRIWHENFIC